MDANEKAFYDAVMIAFGIIGTILAFFFVSIVRQQLRYRKLSRAKINAEIATLEKERKRIAGDLHDDVGPLLSAIRLQINHIEAEDDYQQQLIDKSSQYIDEVIQKMREISNDLLPNVLVRRGLIAAVQDFLKKVTPGTGMEVSFDHDVPQRLPTDMEVNLYRIVQEIVHNTIKHAKATKLSLALLQQGDKLVLSTADNGKGFPSDKAGQAGTGHGMLTLQSRTELMGGDFDYTTAPGKGVAFYFEFPVVILKQVS